MTSFDIELILSGLAVSVLIVASVLTISAILAQPKTTVPPFPTATGEVDNFTARIRVERKAADSEAFLSERQLSFFRSPSQGTAVVGRPDDSGDSALGLNERRRNPLGKRVVGTISLE